MKLFCGVVKRELIEPGICVDVLLYGGEADIVDNIYYLETWRKIFNEYKDITDVIIDGGIHGTFKTLREKEDIVSLINLNCKGNIIIYGNHMLLKTRIAKLVRDPLKRRKSLPFTSIPVKFYTMENFKKAFESTEKIRGYGELRLKMEYYLKF